MGRPWNDEAAKFYEAAKYYYYPGCMNQHHSCMQDLTLLSGVSSARLTKLLFIRLRLEKITILWRNTMPKMARHWNGLINDQGVVVKEFNDDVYAAFAGDQMRFTLK